MGFEERLARPGLGGSCEHRGPASSWDCLSLRLALLPCYISLSGAS